MERLRFLSPELVRAIRERFGTPAFVYDETTLREQAHAALAFPNPYGLTVRFAVKASPNAAILRLFDGLGLHFDASSEYEAERIVRSGIAPGKISLSAQELPDDLSTVYESGMKFVATSLHQLESWGRDHPTSTLAVRFNPGVGSGGNNRTNVGGPHASFGIWHEFADDVRQLARRYSLTIDRIHTHIGSGSDPEVWNRVANMSLALVEQFPDVQTVDLGGGYKVGRMASESSTDLQVVGAAVHDALVEFADRTGRRLHLEIEPGNYLLANSGSLIATIQDIVSTGVEGHEFLRLDAGLTDILRPAMYGAQHPLVVVPASPTQSVGESASYVVVGHCCESGDILSPASGDPETVSERIMQRAAIGDLLVIEGAGAYCSSMSASNYNSFPIAPEILAAADRTLQQIRRRQTLAEMLRLEE